MWRTASSVLRRHVASLVVPSASTPVARQPLAAVSSQIVRSFAGKAEPKEQEVQIPMTLYGVTGKYASALYVTAVRRNVLEPVEMELKDIMSLAEQSEVFREFLKDPSVTKDVRMKAVQEIFGKESKYADVTKNFLAVLAENGRLKELPKIANAYSELVLAHKGEVKAIVTSALELSPEELSGIKDALKGHIKPGQVLNVEQKVDRSIIGGIVIDILDKHIDLSIDTKIKQMEKVLAETM
jgi:F-type H+-transporting ATPase subunit O